MEFLRGRDAAPPLVDERSTSGNVDLELDGTDLFNFNVLVTTTFACKDGQRLRLSTFALATYHSTALPSVRKALFGGGEIALMPSGPGLPVGIVVNSGMRVFTAVDDMEGETLSSEELHASRRLLRAANIARGLQVLVAMKSAIAKKWVRKSSAAAAAELAPRILGIPHSSSLDTRRVPLNNRPDTRRRRAWFFSARWRQACSMRGLARWSGRRLCALPPSSSLPPPLRSLQYSILNTPSSVCSVSLPTVSGHTQRLPLPALTITFRSRVVTHTQMERVSVIIDGRPARTLAARRYRRAVHYEAAGLYREAAALYKQNIDQDLALPGENFLPSQAMEWCVARQPCPRPLAYNNEFCRRYRCRC